MSDSAEKPLQTASSPQSSDRLEALLLAYDTALHNGEQAAPDDVLQGGDELAQDLSCLELMHRVWGSGQNNSRVAIDSQKGSASYPQRIGRFDVVRELGRGGYGIVLLAVDPHLDRRVAIKIPRPEVLVSPVLRDRFLREAEAAGRLDHPNLVPVFEVGEDGSLWYIATAYISGGSLTDWVAAQPAPLSPRAAATIVLLLADAVQHAHSAGILHRDLKPGNVLMQPVAEASGGTALSNHSVLGFVPRLTDFGLAKLLDADSDQTASGAVLGTPSYMAPEQASGHAHQISAATDVYGLGAILYELLAGRPPFRAGNSIETLRCVLQEEVVSPRRGRREIARDLEAICLKCLEKKPAERYFTARELANDLRHYLAGEPTEACTPNAFERISKWCRRNPAWAALVGVSGLALVVLIAGLIWSNITIARHAGVTEAHRRQMRDLLYAANVQLAQQAFNDSDFGTATQMLEREIPVAGGEDRRDFAWRFLWNALHSELARLPKHPAEVYGVAYSPDGQRLATACADGKARIWEISTRKLLATLAEHQGELNVVAFSPDGKLLATGGNDARVVLHDAHSFAVRCTLSHDVTGDEQGITGVVFAPDNARVYTAYDQTICAWDAASGEHLLSANHDSQIDNLALSNDGQLLAVVGVNLAIWTTSWLEPLAVIPAAESRRFRSACFLPGDKALATGNSAGALVIYDVLDGRNLADVSESPASAILALHMSADRQQLVAGATDRTVCVYELNTWDLLRRFTGHTDRVWDVKFSPTSDSIASASAEGAVLIWPVPDPTTRVDTAGVAHWPLRPGDPNGVKFSRDGKCVAYSAGPVAVVRERASGRELLLRENNELITEFEFAADGQTLVLSRAGQGIEVWDLRTGKLTRRLEGILPHASMALSPRGDRIALGFANDNADDQLELRDWPDGKLIDRVSLGNDAPNVLRFSPDGKRLFVGRSRVFAAFDADSLAELYRVRCPAGQSVIDIDFLPDGHRVVTAEFELGAAIRDVTTGKLLAHYSGSSAPVVAVAASRDGRNIVSACENKTVQFWDLTTHQAVLRFEHNRPLRQGGLQFSPDGQDLLLAHTDGSSAISQWSIEPARVVSADSASQASRALSSAPLRNFGGQRVQRFTLPARAIPACGWSPRSDRLLLGTSEGDLFVFRPATDRIATQLPLHFESRVYGVFPHPSEDRILVYERSGRATWCRSNGEILKSFAMQDDVWPSLSPTGEHLFYSETDNHVHVIDAQNGRACWARTSDELNQFSCAAWASGDALAVSSLACDFWLLGAQDGRVLQHTKIPVSSLREICRSSDGRLAGIHRPGGIHILDARTGAAQVLLPQVAQSGSWAGRDRLLVYFGGYFDLYHPDSGELVGMLPLINSRNYCVSPDGAKLASFNHQIVEIIWMDAD